MAFETGGRAVLSALTLLGCGFAIGAAWREEMWGLLAGAVLAGAGLTVLQWWAAARPRPTARPSAGTDAPNTGAHRLLLDAAPTPMLAIEGHEARALNRAARRLFATDDRVASVPAGLADTHARHVRHEGRRWRVDRVALGHGADARAVVALIDVEQEELAAEARATAELIHVLGHELLNGLAPIASLAESGFAAVEQPTTDRALLREIMGTLARRAEDLQQFIKAYRALARLPEPNPRPTSLQELLGDLARLFKERWPATALSVDLVGDPVPQIDREQVGQALWALLQNAAEAVSGDQPNARVSVTVHEDRKGVVFEIEDNGAGVAPAEADRIFRAFYTTKPEGSGIGLGLARQIAQGHGGSLTMEPGTPTTFRLFLPRR